MRHTDTGSQHGTRERGRKQQAASKELRKRRERIGVIRSNMFEILNVLETIPPEDFNVTHAPAVETAVFAIRQGLPMFPMRTVTTVAKRPSGQSAKGRGGRKRAAATETGTTQPCTGGTSVVVIDSNSEREEEVPWDLRWNSVQRHWEHKSSGDNSSDASDDVVLLQ